MTKWKGGESIHDMKEIKRKEKEKVKVKVTSGFSLYTNMNGSMFFYTVV